MQTYIIFVNEEEFSRYTTKKAARKAADIIKKTNWMKKIYIEHKNGWGRTNIKGY